MLTDTVKETYARWCERATEDEDLVQELREIRDNEEAVSDRFYRSLAFGTGGLRGVIGAGENRMNIYTVRKATQGLADYLNARCTAAAVAISFDSRIKSDRFAREAAVTLAANGIRVFLFDELQPTPLLSYAVRTLRCQAGIMVTASHNPAKYNGYKCYGSDGCQMTDKSADEVTAYIREIDIFDDVRTMPFDKALQEGIVSYIEPELKASFLDRIEQLSLHPDVCREAGLRVIYSPLNGTGNKPVREILARRGIAEVTVVPEQEHPDGHFPTAPYPNPEIREAFTCALRLAETVKPDLLLATDPDCDRVGIAVKDGDGYTLMSGNDVGCLLMEYVLKSRAQAGTLPTSPVVVSTIVSTPLAGKIAAHYGCEFREVLTGFKYIGEQIGYLEAAGEEDRFLFGFEESYGYLSGTHVRDKDAVNASMLICEMASYYKQKGLSLLDVKEAQYRAYGYWENSLLTAAFEGEKGMETMARLMDSLRQNPPRTLCGLSVVATADYETSRRVAADGTVTPIELPRSNVFALHLAGGNRLIVRPSGTEPKIKAYVAATGATEEEAKALEQALAEQARKLLTE